MWTWGRTREKLSHEGEFKYEVMADIVEINDEDKQN